MNADKFFKTFLSYLYYPYEKEIAIQLLYRFPGNAV